MNDDHICTYVSGSHFKKATVTKMFLLLSIGFFKHTVLFNYPSTGTGTVFFID